MALDSVGNVLTSSMSNPATVVAPGGSETVPAGEISTRKNSAETAKPRAGAASTTREQAKIDEEQFKTLLNKLNMVLDPMDIKASYSVHQVTGRITVKVVNVETGELIREIPPGRVLDMFATMRDVVGLLLDELG